MKKQFVPILFLLFVIACTKDKAPLPKSPTPVYDTIFPGDFFPLYPGSWWKYVKFTNDTFLSTASSSYMLNTYEYDSAGVTYKSKPKYVPIWYRTSPNDPLAFYKYSTPTTFNITKEKRLVPILSETVGDYWQADYDGNTGYAYLKVESKDNVISFFGKTYTNVILVYGYPTLNFTNPSGIALYAKNIGLIGYEVIHYTQFPPDTTYTWRLYDFHINH